MIRPRATVVLVLLLALMSCQQPVLRQLDEIEQYVHDCPDSALTALSALDSSACASGKCFARKTLLASYARYRAYVDENDAADITAAADYFRQHNDPDRLMKALFFKGYIHECRQEYNQAIVAFSEAEPLAEDLHDPYFAGMICREMGTIFEKTFSEHLPETYFQKSIAAFESGGFFQYAAYVRIQLGTAYQQMGKQAEAKSCYESLMPQAREGNDSGLLADLYSHYSSVFLSQEFRSPEKVIKMLTVVQDSLHRPLNSSEKARIGLAYGYLQNAEQSRSWFSSARQIAETAFEEYTINYYQYLAEKNLGNESASLLCVEKVLEYATSDQFLESKNATVISQSDYFQTQERLRNTELQLSRQQKRSTIYSLLFGITILLSLFLVVLHSLIAKKKRIQEEKEQLSRQIEEMSLKHSSHLKKTMKTGVRFLDVLTQDYWQNQPEKVPSTLKSILEGLVSDEEVIGRIISNLNETRNDLILRLNEQIPSLKKQEILLYCYLAIRLDHVTICAILNKNQAALNSQVYRLRGKIEDSGAADTKEFLEVISR